MDIDDIVKGLKDAGHRFGQTVVNSDGRMVLEVDDVAMFQWDAEDVLQHRATLAEIITRNRGKNLG